MKGISGSVLPQIFMFCITTLIVTSTIFGFSIYSFLWSACSKFESSNKLSSVMTRNADTNYSASIAYLTKYKDILDADTQLPLPDLNIPDTITTWWQAAAMIDWYLSESNRYKCLNLTAAGNWRICQDSPYTIKPPCLVYSFGINWDFSFDNHMMNLGCEVHSFDPSMKTEDKAMDNGSWFHNLGIGSTNTDKYIPKRDMYVKEPQVWKMRTAEAIIKELGHENRVIDVFKMDIEGFEWTVLESMMETDILKYIRQLLVEFHLFPKFPPKNDYVNLYKLLTRFRQIGFDEFFVGPHPKTLTVNEFNIQGDCGYINSFFDMDQTVH